MLVCQSVQGQPQVLVSLVDFLLQALDHEQVCVALLVLSELGVFDLQLLDALFQHLVLLYQVRLALDVGLLVRDLLFLLLHDSTHLMQVVRTADEADLLQRTASNLKIMLVVAISFGQILHLQQENVRDYLDVVCFRVLAHGDQRVCVLGRLRNAT